MDMEKEIKFSETDNIESVVNKLLAAKERGEKVWGKFRGHEFHSDTISMDSAYMEIYGCKKAEYSKAGYDPKKFEYVNNLIQRGNALIFPERYREWENFVTSYPGYELKSALEIMEVLENGATMEEAKKVLEDQNHSGMSVHLVRDFVFLFSKKGPDFWEATLDRELTAQDMLALDEKRQENIRLAEANKNNNGMYM